MRLGHRLDFVAHGIMRNREPRVDVELHRLHEHLGLVEDVFGKVESSSLPFKGESKEFRVYGPVVSIREKPDCLFLGRDGGKGNLEPK